MCEGGMRWWYHKAAGTVWLRGIIIRKQTRYGNHEGRPDTITTTGYLPLPSTIFFRLSSQPTYNIVGD